MRIVIGVAVLVAVLAALVWSAGKGYFAEDWHAGSPQAAEVTPQTIALRAAD
jgi:hypothetical protein